MYFCFVLNKMCDINVFFDSDIGNIDLLVVLCFHISFEFEYEKDDL